MKELESEASSAIGPSEMPNNQRLRRAVSDLTLGKLILTECAMRDREIAEYRGLIADIEVEIADALRKFTSER